MLFVVDLLTRESILEWKMDVLDNLSFRSIFDAATEAMLLTDNHGKVLMVNPRGQNLFGYTNAELSGTAFENMIAPHSLERYRYFWKLLFKKSAERAENSGYLLVMLHRNRKELSLNISFSAIKIQQQSLVLVSCKVAHCDPETEKALRSSEERLRLAKQAAGLGIFDYDIRRNIVYWDLQMREFWGGHSEEVVSYEEFVARIHPEDFAARQKAIDYAISSTASNGEYRAEYRVINSADGSERWIAAMGRVYFEDGSANRLVGVARDITEQKNIQKKLRTQRDEIENIIKQQVAARTATAIAHELNQPLAAISAYSEVAIHAIDHGCFKSDSLKKALEGCVEQTQRAGKSLHELMAFLQKSEVITERLNLNDLIIEALNIVINDGHGTFQTILHLQQNLSVVQCNRIQVQKVLVNLFRNAEEAMRTTDLPSLIITSGDQTVNGKNQAIVMVQDNGPGLDQVMVKRIFDPFYTTKPTGIGMGLAISRAIIEANGGQLWAEPDTNSGAKFYFTLPVAA